MLLDDNDDIEIKNDDTKEELDKLLEPNIENEYDINDTSQPFPPPSTDKYKVVNQLDHITQESEQKATEILDVIDETRKDILDMEKLLSQTQESIKEHSSVIEALKSHFPNVESFQHSASLIEKSLLSIEHLEAICSKSNENLLNAIHIMQYQDINRQKIEKVVVIIRSLSRYLSSIFGAQIDDDKRSTISKNVGKIADEKDMLNNEDIEDLIASFYKK